MRELNAFFPWKVCINLDRRPDRWRRMRERLEALGLGPVERFPAVDGRRVTPPPGWAHPAGAYGCLRSHVEVVERARREGIPRVLILEDDAVFHPETGARFAAALPGLPDDWHLLFFGGIHEREPVPLDAHLARLTGSYSTFAWALDHRVYDAFLDLNAKAGTQVDHANFELQARFPSYVFLPHLAWVEEGYSDAQEEHGAHWYLAESLVLKGAEAAEAQRRTTVVLPAGEYGPALAEHYLESLPGCEVVVVAPAGGWQAGMAAAGAGRDLFLLASPDLFVSRADLAASVLMAGRHDTVIPYRETVELTPEESRRFLAGDSVPLTGRPVRRRPARPAMRLCRGTPPPGGGSVFEAPARAVRLGRGGA